MEMSRELVNDPIIDVVMAAIPIREKMRQRALESITNQTLKARHVFIGLDVQHDGAAMTRNSALEQVYAGEITKSPPDFIAFLDDDDYWYPEHLETLHDLHLKTGADFLFSWFDGNPVLQRHPEFAKNRGREFNPEDPHHTTMNVMVRSWLFEEKSLRFCTDHPEGWELPQEDWRFILDCRDAGAKFAGTDKATWFYDNHGGNTSGLGKNW